MDEANLARLADSFIICEPSRAEQLGTVGDVVEEANVQQEASASRSRAALAGIAVDDDNVLFVGWARKTKLSASMNH